jgi:hypothetical protein
VADPIDTDAVRAHFSIPHAPQTQELDTIGRLCHEVDRLRADLRCVMAWMDRRTLAEFRADPDGARIALEADRG